MLLYGLGVVWGTAHLILFLSGNLLAAWLLEAAMNKLVQYKHYKESSKWLK